MVPVSLLFLYTISELRQIILCMCMYEYAYMMFVHECVFVCAWVGRPDIEVRCLPQSLSAVFTKAGPLTELLHLQLSDWVSLAGLLAWGIARVTGRLIQTLVPMLAWKVPYPLCHLSSPTETFFFSEIKLLHIWMKAQEPVSEDSVTFINSHRDISVFSLLTKHELRSRLSWNAWTSH